jgi:hypothetical protein
MNRTLTILIAIAAMFLVSACDTMMVSQYRVTSIATAKEERARLLESLARVASNLGLTDVTSTSTVKNTLVFYSQPDVKNFAVQLGARIVGDSIVVDLTGGFGPRTPAFKKAEKELLEEMERSFPGKYDVPSPYVPFRESKETVGERRPTEPVVRANAITRPFSVCSRHSSRGSPLTFAER